jgi:hypothetical protein
MSWLRRTLRGLLAFNRQLVMPPQSWGEGVSQSVSPDGRLSPDSPSDSSDLEAAPERRASPDGL